MARLLLPLLLFLLGGCAGGAVNRGAAGDSGEDLLKIRAAAETAYAAKDYAESEKQYTLLAKKVPVEAENWFRLGNIYARTNRPDAAIAAYRETLVREPENRKAWFNMAILQVKSAVGSLEQLLLLPGPEDALTPRSRELLEQLRVIAGGEAAVAPDATEPAATAEPGPAGQ